MICLAATGSRSASMPSTDTDPASGRSSPATMRKRRGLAGAVGPEQRIEFAAANGEIEPVDRGAVETLC